MNYKQSDYGAEFISSIFVTVRKTSTIFVSPKCTFFKAQPLKLSGGPPFLSCRRVVLK